MEISRDGKSFFVNGHEVRQLRLAARMTQADLAEKSGVVLNSIKRLERSRRIGVHSRTLNAVAAALGVEPDLLTQQMTESEITVPANVPLELLSAIVDPVSEELVDDLVSAAVWAFASMDELSRQAWWRAYTDLWIYGHSIAPLAGGGLKFTPPLYKDPRLDIDLPESGPDATERHVRTGLRFAERHRRRRQADATKRGEIRSVRIDPLKHFRFAMSARSDKALEFALMALKMLTAKAKTGSVRKVGDIYKVTIDFGQAATTHHIDDYIHWLLWQGFTVRLRGEVVAFDPSAALKTTVDRLDTSVDALKELNHPDAVLSDEDGED